MCSAQRSWPRPSQRQGHTPNTPPKHNLLYYTRYTVLRVDQSISYCSKCFCIHQIYVLGRLDWWSLRNPSFRRPDRFPEKYLSKTVIYTSRNLHTKRTYLQITVYRSSHPNVCIQASPTLAKTTHTYRNLEGLFPSHKLDEVVSIIYLGAEA